MTTTSTPRRPKRHHDNTNAAEHALGGVLNARTILTDNDANILRFSDVLQAERLLVLAVHETMVNKVSGALARDAVPFVLDAIGSHSK